jgi:hypothetical protein
MPSVVPFLSFIQSGLPHCSLLQKMRFRVFFFHPFKPVDPVYVMLYLIVYFE